MHGFWKSTVRFRELPSVSLVSECRSTPGSANFESKSKVPICIEPDCSATYISYHSFVQGARWREDR